MMAAALGIAEMFVGAASAEVLVVASDQRQANITLKYARRMVELNPALAERVQVYADRLYLPENDATLLPLPAEAGALHGHDPSLQIVDELHVVTEDVWEAVTSVAGKRPGVVDVGDLHAGSITGFRDVASGGARPPR